MDTDSQSPTSVSQPLSRSSLIYLGANLLLFWLFLFNRPWGVGLSLFEVGHLALMLFPYRKHLLLPTFGKAVLALCLTLFFWTRDNFALQAFTLLVLPVLNAMIYEEAVTRTVVTNTRIVRFFTSWLVRTFKDIDGLVASIREGFRGLPHERWSLPSGSEKVLIGLAVAVPLVGILSLLFASADPTYEKILKDLIMSLSKMFTFWKYIPTIDQLIFHSIQWGLFLLYLTFVLPVHLSVKERGAGVSKMIEKATIAACVAVPFGLFILTQIKGISTILEGFRTGQLNPSLFVREGFMQMIVATTIGLGVFALLRSELRQRLKLQLPHWIGFALLAEVAIVTLFALQRVFLYQWEFGLTMVRILGFLLVTQIGGMIAMLFAETQRLLDHRYILQLTLVLFASLTLLLGLINPDELIATWRPPKVEGKEDWGYMMRELSYDAVDSWVERLDDVRADQLNMCPSEEEIIAGPQPQQRGQYQACFEALNSQREDYNLVNTVIWQLADRGDITVAYMPYPGGLYTMQQRVTCTFPSTQRGIASLNTSIYHSKVMVCPRIERWVEFANRYSSVDQWEYKLRQLP